MLSHVGSPAFWTIDRMKWIAWLFPGLKYPRHCVAMIGCVTIRWVFEGLDSDPILCVVGRYLRPGNNFFQISTSLCSLGGGLLCLSCCCCPVPWNSLCETWCSKFLITNGSYQRYQVVISNSKSKKISPWFHSSLYLFPILLFANQGTFILFITGTIQLHVPHMYVCV